MINTPALLIMFRIGARIVASPAKNGALDALRGTQHLLTQAGRDILAAQYQAGYGAGAQVPRPPPPATAAAALSAPLRTIASAELTTALSAAALSATAGRGIRRQPSLQSSD